VIEFAKALGAILASLNSTGATQNGPLTLEQAVSIAENNAFAVRLQKSMVEKSRQKVNQARSNLGPQISLGANYTRFDQEISVAFGAGQSVIIQPIDTKTLTGTLTLPIDISGNQTRLLHADEASKRASDLTLNATYNDTRLSVRQAYFSVLRAQALIDVDQKALADAQGRLDQGQKQFDQQQVARLDVTRYKAQVAQSNADLITAKDNLTLANYAFNLTLARPIQTPVTLVDITDLPELKPSEEDIVNAAQTLRPEVKSAQQTLKALALITRATEQGMNPTLSFQLQQNRTIDPTSFTAFPETTTGTFLLNIPIFDSGITRAKVKQARQDQEQAKISLEQTKLQISQEVRNAIANLTSAKARLDNAIEQVALAAEVFRLAKVRQDAGAGTYYEVIDAESQLTLARNGEVGARYDYLTSYSQLQRAVGSDNIAGSVESANSTPKGGK
jgi:outer membrane protein